MELVKSECVLRANIWWHNVQYGEEYAGAAVDTFKSLLKALRI